ncbi:MAG: metalloregulator ArsR/SmtB family transcription factor [Paracoccaceae bacterium]|nr:metalloregulator ArsR/SmtB family transcription factor [Paracoccaceae bacterium]
MSQIQQLCFRALADPTRREILSILAQGDLTIADVADKFDMTRSAVKKHLTILDEGGLITVETRGRTRVNRLNPAGMQPAITSLNAFDTYWDDRLTALKSAIEKDMQ